MTATRTRKPVNSPATPTVDVATTQTAADNVLTLAALVNPATPQDAHVQDCPVAYNPSAQLPQLVDTAVLPTVPVLTPSTDTYLDDDNRPVAPPTPVDMLSALLSAPTLVRPAKVKALATRTSGPATPLPDAVNVPAADPKSLAQCLLSRMVPGVTYTTQQLIALCGMTNGHYSVHPVHAAAKRLAGVGSLTAVKQGDSRGARVMWSLSTQVAAVAS